MSLCIGSRYKFNLAGPPAHTVTGIVESYVGQWGSDDTCVELRKDGGTDIVEIRGRDVATAVIVGTPRFA